MKFYLRLEFEAPTRPMAGDFQRAAMNQELVNILVRAAEQANVPVTLGRFSVQDMKPWGEKVPARNESES